jgi:hypothetical protein
VIRDTSAGRYVDRHRLHYLHVVTSRFAVKGPSITPRPSQGQPLIAQA